MVINSISFNYYLITYIKYDKKELLSLHFRIPSFDNNFLISSWKRESFQSLNDNEKN